VLSEQKSRLEKKIAREQILLGDLPELSVEILELCRERGHVTISDIAKATGANRNTIKDHVTALVKKAQRARHGAPWRGSWNLVRPVLRNGITDKATRQRVWVIV
jgi:predicted ArsR family transcriptional regulator